MKKDKSVQVDYNFKPLLIFGATFLATVAVVVLVYNYKGFFKPKSEKVTFKGNEQFQYIDPVLVKEYIDTKDKGYILIDTRSEKEYKQSHIKTAINIPLYSDSEKIYRSQVKIEDWIGKVVSKSFMKNKIIIYGYSPHSDLVQVAANMLRNMKIPAKIMAVSWYEWRSNFYSWVPVGEMESFSIVKYVDEAKQ